MLQDPVLKGDDLTYTVKVLEGDMPAKGADGVGVHRYHRHAADAGLVRRGRPAAGRHPVDPRSASYAKEYRYGVPLKFTGKINKLTFKLEPEPKAAAKR